MSMTMPLPSQWSPPFPGWPERQKLTGGHEPTVRPLHETLPYYGLEPSLNMNLSFCDSDDELSALADQLLDPEGGGTSEFASLLASSPLHSLSAFSALHDASAGTHGVPWPPLPPPPQRGLGLRRYDRHHFAFPGASASEPEPSSLRPVSAAYTVAHSASGSYAAAQLPPPPLEGILSVRFTPDREDLNCGRAGSDRPRGRKPLACLFCRGRKIACRPPPDDGVTEARGKDGMKMCDQCSRRGRAICSYPVRCRRGLRSHTKRQLLHDMECRE
ncbi:hypothetical protein GGX14DRAFT_408037 [Mycena pura]|uniref:Zn(2)-C6 fungal-type domain-containing protein n=1 Tax=Mycena pura TaxID=153505 RepID=A0AAD6UMJ2_9AGAR|nr:hypothetical protein GGX14DRAFT_408037 [Mycena pura]